MRLKSIELLGFKSFPDMTRLNFNSGMTVVVGPNGSGKSNISDAIRWVLGELSAKSVRGSKMEDVIFSGTDNRRQKAFAEVSLTIDNSDTECRLDTDLDELTVTRRCLRSGESEYMINRRPVRLRDISELFMNTGVGRTGYSIIGQGKISDIISQRSDERRSIFEEAAGISKYRYKKNETEHKLIALEENLNRVNVILDELNSRIEPLEKESQKARKYLDLYTQKKQTDVKISLYDIDIIKKQSKEIRDAHGIARLAYETANETLISLETQSEKMFDTSQENKLKAERISGKIKEYSEHRQNIINSRLVLQNDILHAKNQINQSETDLKVKIAARESALKSKKQLETDRLALKDTLTELDSQLIITKERLKTLFEQRIVLENNRETVNKQISAEQDENTALKIKLSALKNKSENHAARNTELLNEISACSESVGLIKSRIEKAELLIKDYRQKTDNLNEIIKQTDAGIESHNKELKSLNNEIDGITLELSSKKQRVDTLKRMDELFEGYAHSVRQIMQASESGKLNGIYGPVSRIIEVKPRYAVAIETAIGANIQNIVTENEESAKKAINYLKQNNAGRATFYPLSSMKAIPLNADISSFKLYPGYIAIASELVSYERRYKDVVGYMLGRTVVFDNLDNATLMAKATGYRIRIVTLDGQLINTGGSFTGGSIKKDSGILTRASETEKLSGEITRTQLSLQAKEKAYNELNTALKGYIIKREKLNEELSMLNTVYQAENTQLQVLRTQYSNDVNSLNNYKKEYNEIDLLNESNDTEIETIELTISSAESNITRLKANIDELDSEHKTLSKTISQKQEDYNILRLRITAQQKDMESVEKSVSLTVEAINAIDEQTERIEQTIYNNNENIINIQNKIESIGLESAAHESDIAALENSLADLNNEVRKGDADLQGLRTRIRDQTHNRDNLFMEYNRLETRLEQVNTDMDRITDKLWDDYELTYSSASELGYPGLDSQNRPAALTLQSELRSKLRALGSVNTGVIDEYNEVKARHDFLTEQLDDLHKSKENLAEIIHKLELEMKQRFSNIMSELNRNFKIVFRELFGGGTAELKLADPENILESGIDINVAPPGKIIKNLSLLSGGEQAFVAIALLFAILNVNPTPFCVLDEIDAALDDINVDRFADYVRRYSDKTQFIIITHRRGTMERADAIYGVTMPERGISKILSLNVNEVEQKIGVKI